MNSNFEEIFQGWLEKEEYNKNKGFLKKGKYWRKYFCVLRQYEGDSNVYLQWFEKEEDWQKEFPKGTFALFPKYSVYKHKTERGKSYFEIANDEEAHYFLASNEMTMDLWVIQLMMQTRLSSSMVENSFRVKGGESKHLQRIGAKNLNCLLHLSEWGITLALERTHSVLSQWPLTTIRNYECTDNNKFVFESGRKSPMGVGKYELLTCNSEDNAIFDQLDHYTSLRATQRNSAGGRNRLNSANDEEIAQAYGQLRWSVMLTKSQLNLGVIRAMPSQPQAIQQSNNHTVYNHLDRKPSIQTTSSAIGDSYDRLDRTGSLSERLSWERSYSRMNCSTTSPQRMRSRHSFGGQNVSESFDRLDGAPSFYGSPSSADSRSRSFGSVEGRSRFHPSSPPVQDNYNRLSRVRHASLPSSSNPKREIDFYNSLDRSMASVHHASQMNSYDRLDSLQDEGSKMSSYDRLNSMHDERSKMDNYDRLNSMQDEGSKMNSNDQRDSMQDLSSSGNKHMYDRLGSRQGNVLLDKDKGITPPPLSNDTSEYDVFGNMKAYTPASYQAVKVGEQLQDQGPLIVELPPPLPKKPSFMATGEKTPTKELTPSKKSPTKREKPLPPRPKLNDDDSPEKSTRNKDCLNIQTPEGNTLNGDNFGQHYQIFDEKPLEFSGKSQETGNQHYQATDERKLETGKDTSKLETNDSHYQAIDGEYAEPRSRLNTHSSNPDLAKIPKAKGKGKLDPSKRTTIHRSAPSLALYTTVDKKSKGSPKLTKSSSTFKLFKKLGRSSKKEEEPYEKVQRKNKKSQKKDNVQSTSSLKRLVTEEELAEPYVDIDGEESTLARKMMDRHDSKRPLPNIPADCGDER